MFLDDHAVLHDEHARVGTHNGFERNGIHRTEGVYIYLIFVRKFLYGIFSGTGKDVANRPLRQKTLYFSDLFSVAFVEVIHCDKRHRFFGLQNVVCDILEFHG